MPDDGNGQAGVGPPAEQLIAVEFARVLGSGREALVVTVTGEIDLHTVARFRAAVADGLEQVAADETDGLALVIDLRDVSFLGSPGLQALVEVTRAARRRREPLRIVVNHTRPVVRPIELTGLDGLLALYNTVDQALHTGA
ncbi:MAG TPA: STAS domain-containing protein [Pseudonocardia sp.]|jgi:anti-sigma B factor antagonist